MYKIDVKIEFLKFYKEAFPFHAYKCIKLRINSTSFKRQFCQNCDTSHATIEFYRLNVDGSHSRKIVRNNGSVDMISVWRKKNNKCEDLYFMLIGVNVTYNYCVLNDCVVLYDCLYVLDRCTNPRPRFYTFCMSILF